MQNAHNEYTLLTEEILGKWDPINAYRVLVICATGDWKPVDSVYLESTHISAEPGSSPG